MPGNLQQVPSYWLLDGRFGLIDIPLGGNGGTLSVNLWGKNLANRCTVTHRSDLVCRHAVFGEHRDDPC
jgi:hypothetical protein